MNDVTEVVNEWMIFYQVRKAKKKRVTQRWLLKFTDLFLEKH